MSCFQTYTGLSFCLESPEPWQVSIVDIAHHLSMQCRFNGATRMFYSVAQHSVLVSRNVTPSLALCGLLHDAAEAYLGDCVTPLKHLLPKYMELEERAMRAVAARFALEYPFHPDVKRADLALLEVERRDLVENVPPPDGAIIPLDQWSAERLFMKRFEELQWHKDRTTA